MGAGLTWKSQHNYTCNSVAHSHHNLPGLVASSNCLAMLQVGSPGPGLLQSAGSYESLDEMRRSSLAGGSISMLDTLTYSSCDR